MKGNDFMISEMLQKAREYELFHERNISKEDRPGFHLSSRVGWMNDPNGFSLYNGEYHLFYQYYPYEARWGSMHWAHATSKDLLHWEYKPAVLAPDKFYDDFGCFSGTAITTDDGKHLIMYTSVMNRYMDDGERKEYQQQSIAIGDGENYVKYESNPVISTSQLPQGFSEIDFRDPKIWRGKDGLYRVLIGAKDKSANGNLLLYTSKDCIHWEYKKVFAKNDGSFGRMWECPDFFVLDGKGVLLVSPQDMLPEGFEYHNGNGTLCLIGSYNEDTDEFIVENSQSVDYGIDFYAPQTTSTEDGRRVMIAWMQNWDTTSDHGVHDPFFGQMTLPRELKIVDGRLYQSPVKEFESLRCDKAEYKDVILKNEEKTFDDIRGRHLELDIEVEATDKENLYDKFIISLAKNDKYHTDFYFRPRESVVKVDRKFSGSRRAYVHQRRAKISNTKGTLKAKIILDRNSMEIFLEDGRQVMTTTIQTNIDADQISFAAVGEVKMNIVKYSLSV